MQWPLWPPCRDIPDTAGLPQLLSLAAERDSTTHGPLLPWKGQCFVLPGVDTFSGYGFAFPAHSASVKTTVGGRQNGWSTAMLLHTAWLLAKELTS